VTGRTGPVRPWATRRLTWAATCIALIAVGAILRFAMGAGSDRALNVHTVGVIVIGAGELGLVPLLVWGPLNPVWRHRQQPPSTRPAPPQKDLVGRGQR
jgi:hypothetical protein